MKRILTFLAILSLYFTNSSLAQEKMRIIVMDLKPIGLSLVEGKAISRLLESDIVDSKLFVVVERNQITAVLKEQGFQQTGCTDNVCAVEVGKLLSANKILMGNVSKLGKMIMMTVKIVDVEKGISEFSVNQKAKTMAKYEHLPIYKKAMELAVFMENNVKNMSRYNKYAIGTEYYFFIIPAFTNSSFDNPVAFNIVSKGTFNSFFFQ